ncbi:MAG: hypothetical protein VKK04_25165 [Synechococcales bacterium]|nr:hypothetical protein [Synechococcales bacterium]
MASRRLTTSEKEEILTLYRNPEETTSTLASRYGVSNSTISRILKHGLAADDYETLVQQKRSGVPKPQPAAAPDAAAESFSEGTAYGTASRAGDDFDLDRVTAAALDEDDEDSSNQTFTGKPLPKRRQDRRSPLPLEEDTAEPSLPPAKPAPVKVTKTSPASSDDLGTFPAEADSNWFAAASEDPLEDDADYSRASAYEDAEGDEEDYRESGGGPSHPFQDEMLAVGEDDEDDDEDDEDDEDDDDFDDLDDEDDLEDEEGGGHEEFRQLQFQAKNFLNVLPFSEAQLPKTCYLVIDRAAELITRPLSDFTELGHVSSGDEQARTLPVFDNHRVAKRFSNRRTQRIVKVPDSHLLQKTTPYLQAKGITRLLFDGQVYSLIE